MKTKFYLALLAVITTIGLVSAQDSKTLPVKSDAKKSCYVDANNNNICDKYENKTCTVGNGKGLQNGSGRRQGVGRGNGCCRGKHNGQGWRNGNGNGNGRGANYVDANKNGVCDHRETSN